MKAIRSTEWARIVASPAVPVLCALEGAGGRFTLTDGRLRVKPSGLVTPEQATILKAHRMDVVTIIAVCQTIDVDGLAERYRVYATAFAAGQSAPALVPGLPWQLGACGTCYNALPPDRVGRCDLCVLAFRLAWPDRTRFARGRTAA